LKIGIFGGTFNPPHTGHKQAAKAAVDQLGLDLLIIVPAGIPPHKVVPAGTPSAEVRLEMARLTFEHAEKTEVSDIETVKTEPNYSIDTIMSFKQTYPDSQFFLLTGTDMFLTLDSWLDSEALLRLVTPVVFSRNSEDMRRIVDYSQMLKERYGVSALTIENEIVDISSSDLREMLPVRKGSGYIADTTYSYIIRSRFYNARPDWDWLRARAHSMLKPERIPHVDGCEIESLRLAKRWGVNTDDAREAAILHDITKKLSPEENISILERHGVTVGNLEVAEEKLLHAKSGAELARSEFGVSEDVANAIRWHTTGRAGMSDLEKVIYVADYIEPVRDFEGVEALRALAYENLDKAMKMGLEMSVQDMRTRGIVPNSTTFDALSDLENI